MRSVFKSLFRFIFICILSCILIVACSSSNKKGTVVGVALEEGKIVSVVKLDDGTEVKAIPADTGVIKITGGERVEVEPPEKSSKLWKVVRVLDKEK